MKWHKAAAIFAAQSLALVAIPAVAGVQNGTIADVYLYADGSGADIVLSGTATGHPACATEIYWKLDLSTAAGEKVLAGLLTAYASGRQTYIQGTNTCSLNPTRETIAVIRVAS